MPGRDQSLEPLRVIPRLHLLPALQRRRSEWRSSTRSRQNPKGSPRSSRREWLPGWATARDSHSSSSMPSYGSYRSISAVFYLTGQSMGGAGTWHLIAQRPSVFAGAVICCGSASVDNAARPERRLIPRPRRDHRSLRPPNTSREAAWRLRPRCRVSPPRIHRTPRAFRPSSIAASSASCSSSSVRTIGFPCMLLAWRAAAATRGMSSVCTP
jgi:hypothetical protein